MNRIQKHQLTMALEVDRICKKYKIKYIIEGGTFLGAIRHKGFIPWDDDLDIDMLRSEYDKFAKVAQKELGDKYFFQTFDTDQNYGLGFGKIRENNTLYLEEMSKDVDINNGIFIDIFPIDNFKNDIQGNISMKYNIFLRMLLLLKNNYNLNGKSKIKNIILALLKFCSFFCSKKRLISKIKKIQIKYNSIETDYVADWNCISFSNYIYKKKWYDKTKEYNFEDKKLIGTNYYDEYLTSVFGDYMTPPPLDERENRHGIVKIEFNKKKANK